MGKDQVIFIRGGEAFYTKEQFYDFLKNRKYDPYETRRNWRDWLEWGLSEQFDSITPVMPNKQWADYHAWKIWFEKLFSYLKDVRLILIGQSLGGAFLAKYLSENKFPKHIDQLHLVCPVFNDEGLIGEYLASFNFDPNNLKKINDQVDKVFLYHSRDDPVSPFSHAEQYVKHMKAEFFEFQDRGHFDQPAFMEILQVINKNLS